MQIHELNELSGTPSNSSSFAIDNGTTTYKIDYSALAQALIEAYTGSTLAGSARSVQAAFSALLASINGNASDIDTLEGTVYGTTSLGSETNANNLTTNGTYWVNSANVTNLPTTSGSGHLRVSGRSTALLQEYISYNSSDNAMPRRYQRIYVNAAWSSWVSNNGLLLTKTVTGSTNTSGNLSLSLSATRYAVISAYVSGYIALPYRNSSNNNIYVHVMTANASPSVVASTSVSINVTYIDLGSGAFS